MVALELGVVAFLIVLNGFFAMAESSTSPRAAPGSEPWRRKAAPAPSRHCACSTIRPASFPASRSASPSSACSPAPSAGPPGRGPGRLAQTLGLTPGTAETIGVAVVVAVITYLSLIVGELVPKQIALGNPERIASFVAPPMTASARRCTGRMAARGLFTTGPAPARAPRGTGAAGHRGGDPDARRRGGERGLGRAGGDTHDRPRDAAGRPLRARADDAATRRWTGSISMHRSCNKLVDQKAGRELRQSSH